MDVMGMDIYNGFGYIRESTQNPNHLRNLLQMAGLDRVEGAQESDCGLHLPLARLRARVGGCGMRLGRRLGPRRMAVDGLWSPTALKPAEIS